MLLSWNVLEDSPLMPEVTDPAPMLHISSHESPTCSSHFLLLAKGWIMIIFTKVAVTDIITASKGEKSIIRFEPC
jgi:hypothetical protein